MAWGALPYYEYQGSKYISHISHKKYAPSESKIIPPTRPHFPLDCFLNSYFPKNAFTSDYIAKLRAFRGNLYCPIFKSAISPFSWYYGGDHVMRPWNQYVLFKNDGLSVKKLEQNPEIRHCYATKKLFSNHLRTSTETYLAEF